MSLIPQIPLSQFRQLGKDKVRQLKSCELTVDGEYLCTVIVPQTDYTKTQCEYLGMNSNAVGGKDIEEVQGAEHQ